ncbi:hypothetical protein J4209_07230 [Candidatus Woesearchaeota archaeon]|nr:hypothetical protein [Candidatus Woesearchaeota archaeon]
MERIAISEHAQKLRNTLRPLGRGVFDISAEFLTATMVFCPKLKYKSLKTIGFSFKK